ncbi:MAG: hypothetical protein M5R40_01410 [Anaerolineae bacterium]|nr:hypothetical protein [Anaerolineae bacterium]
MIKEIPRLIANWAVRGPAYCVALMYWPQPWSLFSPMIGVGLESERATWVKQYPERTKMVLWNPVEFMHNGYVTADSDKDIGDVLDLLDQQIFLTGRHDFGMALFDRIVIELQRFNWSDILDITSDFVVIVTDSDYEMFDSHLAATVPVPLLATLRTKGYFELS